MKTKKHLLLIAFIATINATAQEAAKLEKGITTTYGISQITLLNTPAATNYTFSLFLNNDTVKKCLYANLGVALPAKNFTVFINCGSAYKFKNHPKTFWDIGFIVQSDFRSNDVETSGVLAMETAIRFQNLTKLKLLNIRLGIAAGYVSDYIYNENSLNRITKIDNNSGFRIMPTITAGWNFYAKKQ
jgi:hypothetical protein